MSGAQDKKAAAAAYRQGGDLYEASDLRGAHRAFTAALSMDSENEKYSRRLGYLEEEIEGLHQSVYDYSSRPHPLSIQNISELARLNYLLGEYNKARLLWQEIVDRVEGKIAQAALRWIDQCDEAQRLQGVANDR